MRGRGRTPQLLGREDSLRQLSAALDRVSPAKGALALVSGEAGIGKTRLLEEFAAREPDALVARGGCVEGVAYAPWTDALWWLLDELGTEVLRELPGHVGPQLARLIPSLTAVDLTAATEEDGQQLLFDAVVELLRHVGTSRKLVLVVDDMHWIDPASRDLLRYVASSLRRVPIVLIAAYRPEDSAAERDLVAQLGRLADDRVALERLPEDTTVEIASILLGEDAASVDVDRITRDSDGNPLFVEELVAAAESKGIPETLRDLLLARFMSLDADARHLVSVAGVMGARAPRAWLVYASGLPAERTRTAARAAADAGVFVANDGAYEFRHALLRQAVLDELLPDELVELHRVIAQALTDHADAGAEIDRVAELARHWHAAHEAEPALHWLVAAAQHAQQSYAFEAAFEDYERALQWWDVVAEPEEAAGVDRATLLLDAADSARAAGHTDRAGDLGWAGLEASFALDLSRGVEAAGRVSPHLWSANRASDFAAFTDANVLPVLESVEPRVRARFLIGHVQHLAASATAAEMRGPATEMMAALDVIDDPELEARAHMVNAWCYEAYGDFDRVDEEYEQAAALARAAEAHGMLASVLANHASSKSWIPDLDGSVALLEEVDDLNERYGLRRHMVATAAMRALALAFRGDLSESALAIDRIDGLFLEGLDAWARTLSRARIDLMSGDVDTVIDALLLEEKNIGVDDAEVAIERAALLAEAYAWKGDTNFARRAFDEGQQGVEEHREAFWHGLLAIVGVRIEADAAEVASTAGDIAALELAQRRGTAIVEDWHKTTAALQRSVGLVDAFSLAMNAEWARISDESAVEQARAAADRFEAISMPYYATYFRWREAEAMIAAGDRFIAADVLKRARGTAQQRGFGSLDGAITATARTHQLRLGPAKTNVDGDEALSVRELEVLRLLVAGRSNPEIAEELFITRRTAAAHVSNILKKLDATSRVEAASEALRRGYV